MTTISYARVEVRRGLAKRFDIVAVSSDKTVDVLEGGLTGADARSKGTTWARQLKVPLVDTTVEDVSRWGIASAVRRRNAGFGA